MSDEYTEEVADGEVEETLTPEEIFAQHQAEIAERFEEKGFFRRMRDMFSGLSKPHSSPEYKLARTELQRLAAPLLAIMLPVLGIVTLIVITAVTGQSKDVVQVEIASAQEQEEELQEEKEEDPIEPDTPPDEQVDVVVDTPVVGPVTDMVNPTPTPANEPVSVKPATQDSVAIIKSPVTMKSMVGSRTPGMIGKFTSGGAGYGDANTEAAVLKYLRWLKSTQLANGAWAGGNQVAGAAIAVLALLAHGETPASKEFGETVEKAMQFLIDCQYYDNDKDKTVRFKGADGNEYAVLLATYALCEAYGMTKNPLTKDVALRSLDRIVKNQSPTGGWDYKMVKTSTRDDMSYAGWALQALKAGKMAGLHPDGLDECIKKAIRCLQKRNFNKIGFNYCANGQATGLTATGCLAMQLLGYGNQPEVATALDTMKAWKPVFESKEALKPGGPTPGSAPQYYCYYAAQCKYQAGMREGAAAADVKIWQDWNAAMKALYPKSMKTLDKKIMGPDGKEHQIGFWPKGYGEGSAGSVLGSGLVALQLMVYYRYLPTTQTKAGKVESHDDNDKGKTKTKKKVKKETVDVDVDI